MYLAPLVAMLVSVLMIAIILRSSLAQKISDIPNERSLHRVVTPRIGGIGLFIGVFSGWALMQMSAWPLIISMLLVFSVSLLDDKFGLPVRSRLLAHVIAASTLIAGMGAGVGYVGMILVLLCVVWMTNLYNFMDGSDGLAGGMAVFGFGNYGFAAMLAQNETLALMGFCVVGAALGFLFFNFHPAKIFMGDAGSIPLGFLAAAMGVWGWQQNCWPAWFPFLVFSPFIVDASVTLTKRFLRGVKVTEAHREHYYQRAIQMGWGHRKLALAEYVLMALVGQSALLFREQCFPWLLLLIWAAIYVGIMLALDRDWRQFQEREQA